MSQHLGRINLNDASSSSMSNSQLERPGYKATKPHINLIPQMNSHSTLAFPPFMSKPLVNPGYQEAHQLYHEMRTFFTNKAYSNVANAEVIVVKVWMMMRVPNRKTAAPVSVHFFWYYEFKLFKSTQDIFEALQSIPVHIGAEQLKLVLYHALLPHYVKWSKGFPLPIEECQIRNKLWVELVPKHPDVDAVADYFFTSKGKNKAKAFTPKQGIDLFLVITHEKYEAILQHLSDMEEVSLFYLIVVYHILNPSLTFSRVFNAVKLPVGQPLSVEIFYKQKRTLPAANEKSESFMPRQGFTFVGILIQGN